MIPKMKKIFERILLILTLKLGHWCYHYLVFWVYAYTYYTLSYSLSIASIIVLFHQWEYLDYIMLNKFDISQYSIYCLYSVTRYKSIHTYISKSIGHR